MRPVGRGGCLRESQVTKRMGACTCVVLRAFLKLLLATPHHFSLMLIPLRLFLLVSYCFPSELRETWNWCFLNCEYVQYSMRPVFIPRESLFIWS